jgi:hypothetical protein
MTTLASIIMELADTQHLVDILTRVKNNIYERNSFGKKTFSQVTTTLRKDVHLFISGFIHAFSDQAWRTLGKT